MVGVTAAWPFSNVCFGSCPLLWHGFATDHPCFKCREDLETRMGCHEDIPQQHLGLAGPEPSPAAIARLNGMNALYVLAVYSTEGS